MQLVPAVTPEIAGRQVEWASLPNEERGRWITAAIKVREINGAELGRRLALTPQTISAWTTGKAEVDWSRWLSVCLVLDLPQMWKPGDPVDPLPQRKRAGAR